MNCCKAETGRHKRVRQNVDSWRWHGSSQGGEKLEDTKEARNWKIEGQTRRITRKECQKVLDKFEMAGFMTQKGLWNLAGETVLQAKGRR